MENEFVTEKIESLNVEYNLDNERPSFVKVWHNNVVSFENNATHFGYIFSGTCTIKTRKGSFSLTEGMYFSVPEDFIIEGQGIGLIISRIGVKGLFYIGGQVEKSGRLKYIDGCTDTLLIPPVLYGYPCMNFLQIPPNINQTAHTHSSVRVGIVISGNGFCKTIDKVHKFNAGTVFILPIDGIHSFHTEDDELRIVVYHPDSDFGPTHDDHPMLNKTFVDGVVASKIESIRTKEVSSPNF